MAEPQAGVQESTDEKEAVPADAAPGEKPSADAAAETAGEAAADDVQAPSAEASAPENNDTSEVFECSDCLTTATLVWRRDRESKDRLCNRCYQTKWPYGAQAARRAAATKVEVEPAAASPGSSPAKRIRPAPQEAESSVKRPKAEAVEDTEQGDASDTEYLPVDLTMCPPRIRVESSEHDKLDGTYVLRAQPSRGKPAYVKEREGKKSMFLYHNKKWMLGVDFGSAKRMYASAKSSSALTPCEPFPNCWKVDSVDGGAKTLIAAMRVVDEAAEEAAALEPLPAEPDEIGTEPGSPGPGSPSPALTPFSGKKHRKRRRDEAATSPKEAKVKREAATAGSDVKVEAGAKEGSEPAQEGNNEAEGQSEKADEAASSESDSGSDDSSSESSASAPEPAATPQRPADDPKKLMTFEKRIRDSLVKFSAHESLDRINKMTANPKGFVKMSGLSVEAIKAFAEQLKAEFTEKAKHEAPREPPAPVPKDLAGAGGSALPTGPQANGGELPTTPPEEQGTADLLPHRTSKPGRSLLKAVMQPRRQGLLVSHQEGQPGDRKEVANYREYLEKLWFTMPGSYVFCDTCDMQVTQSEGSLQGAPGCSQFAQNMFVCHRCTEAAMDPTGLDGPFRYS